jgi:hypothetical protein
MAAEVDNTAKSVPSPLQPALPCERRLLESILTGGVCVPLESIRKDSESDALQERILRGEFLAWACTEFHARALHPHKRLEIRSAVIQGDFDLSYLEIDYPLLFVGCTFEGEIRLTGTKLLAIAFDACDTVGVTGAHLECKHSFDFVDSSLQGSGMILDTAAINGNLRLQGSHLHNAQGAALNANKLTVRCHAYWNEGFQCFGSINLRGAFIGGDLTLAGALLESPDHVTMRAEQIQVGGGVYLSDGFRSMGTLRFSEARIAGRLQCEGGFFDNAEGIAFEADGIRIDGPALFRYGFQSRGTVRLYAANLGSDLDCNEAVFKAPDSIALQAGTLVAHGGVKMGHGFYADGQVILVGARIDGELDCQGGSFNYPKGAAILADGISVQGSVFFRTGFVVRGSVNLNGAHIGGELDCHRAEFLGSEEGACFLAQQMTVNGDWRLEEMVAKPRGDLLLNGAKVQRIFDDETSWPAESTLILHGFEYESFLLGGLKDRLHWLSLQRPEYFDVQPYEHLASVYRKMGLRDDARRILIRKENYILSRTPGFFSRQWKRFLGLTIDYGYTPYKLFLPILLFMLLGAAVFGWANTLQVITPTSGPVSTIIDGQSVTQPYPLFEPLLYSIDVFLPIVDLHQENYWLPNTGKPYGLYFMLYMIFHIIAGWVLTTLGVAAVTGLVRTD